MNQLKRLLSIALSTAILASAVPAFAIDSLDTNTNGNQNDNLTTENSQEITVSLRFQLYGEHASQPIEYTFNPVSYTHL